MDIECDIRIDVQRAGTQALELMHLMRRHHGKRARLQRKGLRILHLQSGCAADDHHVFVRRAPVPGHNAARRRLRQND